MSGQPRSFNIALLVVAAISCVHAATTQAAFAPNDPLYNDSRQLQPYLGTIGMPDAWMTSLGSTNVTVAVLDTGVITTTPDLAGRILPALSTARVVGMLLPPFTDQQMLDNVAYRHGTWVSSSFTMGVNNQVGGAGVGNFSILPIRIVGNSGFTNTVSASDGIRLAADQGARVISISYGLEDYGEADLAAAYARSKGALVFMGGGNSNMLAPSILDSPNIIFVGGTNQSDERWVGDNNQGSTWGNHIDIAAPADNLLIADPTLPTGYGLIDGTSFSTPLVAGAAALAWSINPNLTASQVESMLFTTAIDVGPVGDDIFFGAGRLNVAGVANAALASVPEPATAVLVVCGMAWVVFMARRQGGRGWSAAKPR
jgi:subtilisin family serine protease